MGKIAQGDKLSASDRRSMMEQYKAGQMKQESFKAKKGHVLSKEDMLNLPRHKVVHNCSAFDECPLCYKCRSYNSSHLACRDCVLAEEGSICNKEKHNEQVLNMMVRRERIDLDANAEKRKGDSND